MFKVLVSDPISDLGLEQLTKASDVEVVHQTGLSEDELVSRIGDYDALLVRSQTKVTRRIMEAGTNLKVIGRAGVGVDNIDLEAATSLGIMVINAPDGNTITTSEHTFAMIMALSRHIPQAYVSTVGGSWDRKSYVGVELRGKKLGVLGLGRIGTEVAKRAKAFGMELIGYDPFMTEERAEKLGIQLATVYELIQAADFMTVHTPLTDETRHMISHREFGMMKRGMRIVNCARGGIIDEMALLEALEQGVVAGAAFDVFEEEPPSPDHPFLHHPKVVVTPHLGASTIEAQENVAIDVSEQVLHILRGEPFKNAVNMPHIPGDTLTKVEPFLSLANRLGSAIAQMTDGAVQEIVVDYEGELASYDTALITRYAVSGVLTQHLGQGRVNMVNAFQLAQERGVQITEQSSSNNANQNFANLITLTLKTAEETRWVSGTLQPGHGGKMVRIGPYPVDVAMSGYVLLISHKDVPGTIGRVGTVLGDHEINIATMQVGRATAGGNAVMTLHVDKRVPEEVMALLTELPEVNRVREIVL